MDTHRVTTKYSEILPHIVAVLQEHGPLPPRMIFDKLDERETPFGPELPPTTRVHKFGTFLWTKTKVTKKIIPVIIRDKNTHLYHVATPETIEALKNSAETKANEKNQRMSTPTHWRKKTTVAPPVTGSVNTYLLRTKQGQLIPVEECQELSLDGKNYLLVRLP